MNKKHGLLIFVSFLLSVLLLWLVLKDINFPELLKVLLASDWAMLIPLLLTYAAHYWLKALRWHYLLLPMRRASTLELLEPMMMGFFANNLLPAHMGEFVRMYLAARKLSLSNMQVLATLILERIFDVLAVLLFLGLALVFSANLPELLRKAGYVTALLVFLLGCGVWVYVVWTQQFIAAVARLLFFLPHKIRYTLLHHLELGSSGLHAIKEPRLLLGILWTSVLQWMLMGLTIYVSMLAVGLDTGILSAFVVLVLIVVAVTIPTAPGFFGAVQAAFVYALLPYHVGEQEAVAASIFFHLFTYLAVTLPGFYLLHRLGLSLKRIKHDSEVAEAEV